MVCARASGLNFVYFMYRSLKVSMLMMHVHVEVLGL